MVVWPVVAEVTVNVPEVPTVVVVWVTGVPLLAPLDFENGGYDQVGVVNGAVKVKVKGGYPGYERGMATEDEIVLVVVNGIVAPVEDGNPTAAVVVTTTVGVAVLNGMPEVKGLTTVVDIGV